MRDRVKTKHGWVSLNVENIGSPRMLVVVPRQHEARDKQQKDFRKKLPDGAVLISKHEENNPEKRFYQIYKDGVYTAIRSRVLIQKQYGNRYDGGERGALHLNINSARMHLEALLHYRELSREQRDEVHVCLEELATLLELKRNLHKSVAHDFIELSAEPQDSLGRINPGVCCNQLSTGMKFLNFRLLEIPNIMKYIGRDEALLIMIRDKHLTSCQQLYWRLQAILDRPVLKKPKKNQVLTHPELDPWIMRRVMEVSAWNIGPFSKTRWNTLRDLNEARLVAAQGDYVSMAKIFRRVVHSLRFKIAQFWLEDAILKVSLVIESLKQNPDENTDYYAMNRAGDLGEEMKRLRKRFSLVLDDRGFRRRPKARLIQCLDDAERAIGALEWPEAKDCLKAATAIL